MGAFSKALYRHFPIRRLSYVSKTVLNPSNYTLTSPSGYNSLLLFSTPSNLPKVIEETVKLHETSPVQIVVAGVDSLVPNSHRNGVAELWLKEPLKITKSIQVDERDDLKSSPKESDGVNIVVARKNWKTIQSNLKLILGSTNVDLALANTVFTTGNLVTMYYFQPTSAIGETANSGHNLCDLTVELPLNATNIQSSDRLTPLYDDEVFTVTDCIGNLVKKVNDLSASGFLENNDKLMSIGSKDTEVYVKLYRPSEPQKAYKYQVIAGGGGWGAKASIIALSPEAKVSKGDRIEFYMLTPENRWERGADINGEDLKGKIALESTFEEQLYGEREGEETELVGVFGCGSEGGVRVNGVRYKSAGERVVIEVQTK